MSFPELRCAEREPHRGTVVRPATVIQLVLGLAMLAVEMLASAKAGEGQHGETAITCTNPASGVSWQVRIDYDRGTADSNPARIGEAAIRIVRCETPILRDRRNFA